MTNGWVDIRNADVILVMGGNPAENHPCGFKWTVEAKRHRNAKLVVVDPRFTRTASVADVYAPIRPGTDIAFLNGLIRYALETGRYHEEYVRIHTAGPYIVGEKFSFDDGLFSGFDPSKTEYDKSAWAYEPDPKTNGYQVDPTMKHPRCTLQLLKKHVERYTPEMVERICGTPKDSFLKVAEIVTSTGNAQRVGTITYALGWTQHSVGVQMIRAAATLQLLLGNVGRPGGGVNAMRGHSNIQGATDIAGTFDALPGYLATPDSAHTDLKTYLKDVTPTTLNQEPWPSMNYYQNYPKFMVSLLKSLYGEAATKENQWGYQWLPKVDGNYSWLYIYDDMYRGSSVRAGGTEAGPEGLLTFGFNPVGVGPNTSKIINALSKLKFLVVGDNYQIETATFWKAPKQYGGPETSLIQTEVFQLPCSGFAETDGSFTNSARWLQWKWKALDPPGQAKTDQEVLARIFLAVRDLYRKEGGALPEAVLNVTWNYSTPQSPDLGEVLKDINGKAVTDLKDKDGNVIRRAGQQLDGFGQLGPVRRLHPKPGRGGAPLCAVAQRRAVRRALRGDRGSDREPTAPQGDVEPGDRPVPLGQGRVRNPGPVPRGLHHLPAHRDVPLLDPPHERAEPAPARVLHRDPGGARPGKGDRQRLAGAGYVGARLHRGSRHGDEAPAAAHRRRQARLAHRLPAALGLRRRSQARRAAGELPHALGDGSEHLDA